MVPIARKNLLAEKARLGVAVGGVTFASVVGRDNLVATQFHPEKSGASGLRMYENFLRIAAGLPAGR